VGEGSFDSCCALAWLLTYSSTGWSRPERQTTQHDGSFVFQQFHVSDLFLSGLVVSVTSLITVSPHSIPLTLLFLTYDIL
jgi:hypothetical protein